MLARATSRSHLGRVLVGLRDAESRTRFRGCRVEHDKLVVWIVSAMMADALVGAALGAMTVALAGPLLTGWLPDAWIYALGALFIRKIFHYLDRMAYGFPATMGIFERYSGISGTGVR